MAELLNTVLAMSLTGSYVIVFVVVLRWLLRRLPKSYTCALWAVVLFRLLSPVTVHTPASVLPQPALPRAMPLLGEMTPLLPNPALPLPQVLPAAAPPPDLMTVLAWVWLGGALLLLGYSAICYLRLHRRVAGAVWVEANVYESAAIGSPFVLGLIKPKIYLPPDISPIERSYILRHEQIHIRTFDYLIKPLAFGTLCLHWFNPLCWLAFVLFGRDMEMSCDERVIRELGDNIRPNYSSSLLAMSTKGGFIGGGPLAFGESGVGQRIKNVLNFRKPAFWLALLAVLVVALAVGGLATNPVIKQDASETGLPPGETSELVAQPTTGDPNVSALFEENFLALAQSGRGAYYNRQNNQLFGRELIESFIGAVEAKQSAQLTYLVDSTNLPYVYVLTAREGDSRFTIDQYQQDGTKESFQSDDASKGGTYYRFGYALAGGRFPLYIPFGIDDPTRAAELQKLYEDYLQVLTGAGIVMDYWPDPGPISPESFMAYYVLSSDWWNKKEFDAMEKEVPGAEVEAAILEHFDVPVRRLRAAVNYDETRQVYTFTIENYGYGPGDVRVTNYTQEGDLLTLIYEFYSPADGTTITEQGELVLQVQGDNYSYLSNDFWMLG